MSRPLRRFLLGGGAARALTLAAVAFAFVQALRLRLSYYDSWDYWNDARALLGEPGAIFYRVHGPLEGALLSPLVATLDRDGLGPWVGPHLLHAALAALTLGVLHAWLAPLAGRRSAAVGVLALAATRLFVRYAPHALVDVPAAGWVAATLAAWDRAETARTPREGARWAALAGLALGAGMLHKYTLLALPGALGAGALLRAREAGGRARLRRLALSGFSSLAVFGAGFAAAFLRTEGRVGLPTFLDVLAEARASLEPWGAESPADYIDLALRVASPLVFALAALGVLAAARSWQSTRVRRALPGLLWLPLAGGLLAFGLPHNEARYLLPLWPSLALLVALGTRSLLPLARRSPRLASGTMAAGLALLAAPAVSQAAHDLHPAFARPTQPAFASVLRQALLTPSRVLWHGEPIPLVTTPRPEAPVLPADEFFDVVHLAHPFVAALGERSTLGSDRAVADPVAYLLARPGEVDLLVRGAEEVHYTTRFVEGVRPPDELELWVRSRWRFAAPGALGGLRLTDEGRLLLESPSPGLASDVVHAAGGHATTVGLAVDGTRLGAGTVHDVRDRLAAAKPGGVVVTRVEHLALPLGWE